MDSRGTSLPEAQNQAGISIRLALPLRAGLEPAMADSGTTSAASLRIWTAQAEQRARNGATVATVKVFLESKGVETAAAVQAAESIVSRVEAQSKRRKRRITAWVVALVLAVAGTSWWLSTLRDPLSGLPPGYRAVLVAFPAAEVIPGGNRGMFTTYRIHGARSVDEVASSLQQSFGKELLPVPPSIDNVGPIAIDIQNQEIPAVVLMNDGLPQYLILMPNPDLSEVSVVAMRNVQFEVRPDPGIHRSPVRSHSVSPE